jgi:hypothetical protein
VVSDRIVKHCAGGVTDRKQRCEWCDVVLVEWIEEIDPRHPRELFFKPGVVLIDDGRGCLVPAGHDYDLVPSCIPDVEGVDVR